MREFTTQDARHLVGSDKAVILEIGANDGEHTVQFLDEFPSGIISCFECDDRAIRKWEHRLEHYAGRKGPNGLDRAVLWPYALSDHNGHVMFHPSGGTPPGKQWEGTGAWDKSGSILAPDRHQDFSPWLEFGSPVRVECRTLDGWVEKYCDDRLVFDFVWMDVQGAEKLVLLGAGNCAQRVRYWYLECDPRPNYHGQASLEELDDLLGGYGFERCGNYGGYNFLWGNSHL